MGSFYEKAKKIIKENQDLLAVFEEYDKTGKFRKRTYKKRADFTIDEDILNRFRSYCKKNNINMSAKIESLIMDDLKKGM
ncbi:MAG: hypothetical protein ABIJ08_02960 [Nanoarchaeota archaeon]